MLQEATTIYDADMFSGMRAHAGHTLRVYSYNNRSVLKVECEDCNEVAVAFNAPDLPRDAAGAPVLPIVFTPEFLKAGLRIYVLIEHFGHRIQIICGGAAPAECVRLMCAQCSRNHILMTVYAAGLPHPDATPAPTPTPTETKP